MTSLHTVSIVIPVYRGSAHLPSLLEEIALLTEAQSTPAGHTFEVTELILVHDCGPDHSDRVIREANDAYEWVRPVWLSRNFGQHPATIAGMAS
ncbi:glycosyltransferase, partial [Aeromicrobium sp.]|uniref:glycosyltransferase n=1 Tax=Aeromicrobium sp. TaxID=1871063 RepID=UPI0019AB3E76